MKRKILFTISLLSLILFLSPSLLNAQFSAQSDVILTCKNGSVYKGQLIGETTDYFKLKILEDQNIIVSKDQVKKVERGTDYLFFNRGKKHKLKGIYFGAHYGLNIPNPNTIDDDFTRQLQLLLGYHIDSRLSVGASVELSVNEQNIIGVWISKGYISPSLFARYYLSDTRFRPFVTSQMGYGFEIGMVQNPQHGFTMQNGIGVHLAAKGRTRVLFSVGHYLQRMKGSERFTDTFSNEVTVSYKHWISRPMFKIGVEIN